MVQNNFDKYLIDKPFIKDIKTKNKALYGLSNAITDNQKTIIRKRKKTLLDKIKKGTIIPPGNNSEITKLTSENLEKRLINALDRQPDNANILGKAIDFFIKVKGTDTEGLDREIDMEGFLKVDIGRKAKDGPAI